MPSSPSTVASLRSLIASRFPGQVRPSTRSVPTEIRALDDALGGGLPSGRFTEIVSSSPGSGGQTILAQLLRVTRKARQRFALVDGADGFVPDSVPPDHLRHLVWVRSRSVADVMACADILLRDGNYAIVALDTRGLSERSLLRIQATTWHRLRHAAENGSIAVVVLSTAGIVPAVPWRLVLSEPLPHEVRREQRDELADHLHVEIERGREVEEAKSA